MIFDAALALWSIHVLNDITSTDEFGGVIGLLALLFAAPPTLVLAMLILAGGAKAAILAGVACVIVAIGCAVILVSGPTPIVILPVAALFAFSGIASLLTIHARDRPSPSS
ncbi:MAG TPA: hypothetical protein VKR24_09580 [Candidatus Limnocylindrales bacterium]|nr:hypothetical protein [Candidatus Limnocylindrales bacterium]